MVKSILKTSDSQELPDNLQDAQALAGLFSQVANESVTICRNVDPSSVPGGDKTDLAEKTGNMISMLNEMKQRRYTINQPSPQPTPPPPPPVTQHTVDTVNTVDTVYNYQDTRLVTPQPVINNDDNQLELNLNPTTTERAIDLLERIENHLSKMYRLMERVEQRELEQVAKKAAKKVEAAAKKKVKQ